MRILARPAFSNRDVNPYNWLLYRALQARGLSIDEYGLGGALFGKHDVFHVHWPESTFNATLAEGLFTTELLIRAMDRMKARGTRMLWTAHNLQAHERRYPRAEAAFWRRFLPLLDGVISLSATSREKLLQRFPLLSERPIFLVPHHHYRTEYPVRSSRAQARRELGIDPNARVVLFFGRVLGYKNVPALVRCFRELPPSVTRKPTLLLIAGRAHDKASELEVRAAAAGDVRVRLRLVRLSKAELEQHLAATDLVVLPYRELHNSGSAIMALSLDRPLLMPSQAAGEELRRSIAGEWVQLYERLDPETLLSALLRAPSFPALTDGSHLADLDPELAAARTHAAYSALVG